MGFRIPPTYLGNQASLYASLEPHVVSHLERVARMRLTGHYADALAVFENELLPYLDHPAVLNGLAELYLTHFRYRDLFQLLDSRISRIRNHKAAKSKLDKPEWRLLALMHAIAAHRHRGIIDPGIYETQRTREWLADLPLPRYTGMHVQCVKRYVTAYLFTASQIDYDDPKYCLIPRPESSKGQWQGLTDLRKSLIDRGMIYEAVDIFRLESALLNPLECCKAAEEVLEVLKRSSDLPHSHHLEALVRWRYAELLRKMFDSANAKAQSALSAMALDAWLTVEEVKSKADVPLCLDLEYLRLGFCSNQKVKLEAALKLVDQMSRTQHSQLQSCLNLAAQTATEVAKLTGKDEDRAICNSLYERLEKFDDSVLGDTILLTTHMNNYFGLAQSNSLLDARTALEWIDGFLKKYPDFKAPKIMGFLQTRRQGYLMDLGDQAGARAASAEAEKSRAISGNYYHFGRSDAVPSEDSALAEGLYDSEEDASPQWSMELFDDITRSIYNLPMSRILDLAAKDAASNVLCVEDIRDMLDLSKVETVGLEIGEAQLAFERLRKLDSQEAFRKLWLPRDNKDISFQRRSDLVVRWLRVKVKGSQNYRRIMLMRFLDTRQRECFRLQATKTLQNAMRDENFFDLAIKDCESLIELTDSSHQRIKDVMGHLYNGWHYTIARIYDLKFFRSEYGNFLESCPPYLLEAGRHCKLSVEGYQKLDRSSSLAEAKRFLAQIYLRTINLLKTYQFLDVIGELRERSKPEQHLFEMLKSCYGAPDTIEEQTTNLRKEGVRYLIDSEELISDAEREASWEDGVPGVERRQELARKHQNFVTVRDTIKLLLEGTQSSPKECNVAIWDQVQKYKARSLCTTIGMFRTSPPGLVQNIQASTKEAPMYKKMLDIQRQIDRAAEKDRYHLRLRLDELRKKMKGFPLLRHLIALREGTPLSLKDVEELGRHNTDPVVLVDWIYLSPAGDDGKLLLLTARAGQTPTIDHLEVDVEAIQSWKRENLNFSTWFGENANGPALAQPYSRELFSAKCGGLVAPLAKRTLEGDTLVLCPTDFLHGLPLHALNVDDEALIRRNPCIYTHSHSLLRPCFSSAQYASDTQSPMNAKFLSGIAGVGLDKVRYAAGRDSIVELAERLSGMSMIDDTATKNTFLKQAMQSRLVHLQAHCRWDSQNPLDHLIQFPRRKGNTTAPETLTAREVFGIKLQQGTHINVIACSGGLTDVKGGDEVMGLVPALLYSGVSSVISTLWPINDRAGAQFSKAFFDEFVAQRSSLGGTGRGWVNLAKAVRRAVMTLDPGQDEGLLSWAGFVGNGYWMFAV